MFCFLADRETSTTCPKRVGRESMQALQATFLEPSLQIIGNCNQGHNDIVMLRFCSQLSKNLTG